MITNNHLQIQAALWTIFVHLKLLETDDTASLTQI